jgi:hypothetical protein
MNRLSSDLKLWSRFSRETSSLWLGILLISAYGIYLRIPLVKSPTEGFRQTQTAWPVKNWINTGTFDPFSPVVPIRGVPQEWLFEFPLFQWTAYLVSRITHSSPDMSMVIVAVTCWMLSGILVSKIIHFYSNVVIALSAYAIQVFSIFGLITGSYGLIDHMGTLMGVSALYLVWKAFAVNNLSLMKMTIFRRYAFMIPILIATAIKPNIALMYLVPICWILFRYSSSQKLFRLAPISYVLFSSALVVVVWSHYASAGVDSGDPRSIWYFSSETATWFFGSLSQYINMPLNLIHIFYALFFQLGSYPFVVAAILGLTSAAREIRAIALSSLTGILLSVGLFVNLNRVHPYYLIPAVPLLLIAIGFGIAGWQNLLRKSGKSTVSVSWMTALTVSCVLLIPVFMPGYLRDAFQSTQKVKNISKLSSEIRSIVKPNELIIGFNMTHDPTFLYQSDRKGFLVDSNQYPKEMKFLSKQNPKIFCYVVDQTGEFGVEAQQVIARYPGAKRISLHIWDLCP